MYVEALKLQNIKVFEELNLEFARSGEGAARFAGFNVFVGGNASGKSTLLKSIVMALAGPTVANQQLITTNGWIRRTAKKGLIELRVRQDPANDTFRNSGKKLYPEVFHAGLVFDAAPSDEATATADLKAKEPQQAAAHGPWYKDFNGWFCGAYGPFRRLTGNASEALRYGLGKGKMAGCVTLFDEDASLSESEVWLKWVYSRALEQKSKELPVSPLLQQVTDLLNDGLLPDGFRIARVTLDHIFMITPNGGELPLQDLSDGCRSAFALILDIIHNMTMSYPGSNLIEKNKEGRVVVNKQGVILIDELEAHLHPSWQRLICEWLKTRFPLVQFFVTTHSPLIAQAADEGGVFVLPLPNEVASGQRVRRLAPHEQNRVILGSAEKVLLGEAFGLKYTWGTRAERLVEEWERLASLRHAIGSLPPDEEKEFQKFSKQVEIVFDDLPEKEVHA